MANQTQANGESSYHTIPIQINGVEVITGTTFDVIDPSTESTIWKSSAASIEDVRDAVQAAQAAFPAWANKKPSARRDILLKAADILEKRTDELVEYMKRETASNEQFAFSNVRASAEQLREVASSTAADAGYIPVSGQEGRSVMVMKEPYGVVLGIAPWYLSRRMAFSTLLLIPR